MYSVSVQIQRVMNDAFSNQVLPPIQNAIMAGSGQMTKEGWNVPAVRPETNPKGLRSEKASIGLRSEQAQSRQHNDQSEDYNAYYKRDISLSANVCVKTSEYSTISA